MSDLYIPDLATDDFGPFVEGLADNFNLLGDSRIVEHGENENGYYAMFACGIIISFLAGPFRLEKEGNYFQNPWNLPRSYVEIGSVDFKLSTASNSWDRNNDRFKVSFAGIFNAGITSTTIPLRVASNPDEAFDGGWVDVFCLCAIGRWK